MAIITTYPFKKAPLNKNDEIIISDAQSNNPNFKTKSTSIDNIAAFVIANDSFIYDGTAVASDNWVIVHNLNKYVQATVVDTANEVNIGDIKYNSLNQITITFSAPFSGYAYLN
jgi:hypothetical protein